MSWLLMLACSPSSPMEPCMSTSVWNMDRRLPFGQVQNLWVHDNRLVANNSGMDNRGIDLQDVTIEGNHADGEPRV